MACTGSTGQNTITNIGDTRDVVINVVDCDGAPVDVTDYSLTYTLSLLPGGTPLLTKTETAGITVDNDVVMVRLSAANTILANKAYHHELVISSGGVYQTIMLGAHLFTHSSVSSCEALTATMNLVMFEGVGPQYMLDFSSMQNAVNFRIFMGM